MLLSPPFQNLLVGFIKPLAVVWGARENGHLDQSSFPNLSKHPTKSLGRTTKMELQEAEACNSSYLFTKKTFTKQWLYTLETPGIQSLEVLLWWFLAHFKQPWNEVLIWRKETHLGSTCVLSSLIQSFDWFKANIKYLLFARYKALGEKHLQVWCKLWES